MEALSSGWIIETENVCIERGFRWGCYIRHMGRSKLREREWHAQSEKSGRQRLTALSSSSLHLSLLSPVPPKSFLWETLPQFGRNYELTECCLLFFLGTFCSLPCSYHVQLLSSGQWMLGRSDIHQSQAWSLKTPYVIFHTLLLSHLCD